MSDGDERPRCLCEWWRTISNPCASGLSAISFFGIAGVTAAAAFAMIERPDGEEEEEAAREEEEEEDAPAAADGAAADRGTLPAPPAPGSSCPIIWLPPVAPRLAAADDTREKPRMDRAPICAIAIGEADRAAPSPTAAPLAAHSGAQTR